MHVFSAALVALAATAGVHAHPHSSQSCTSSPAVQPDATASAEARAEIHRDLLSAPTAIERFRRLLFDQGQLRTGESLEEILVFDFNGAPPAQGATGGVSKAAVSTPLGCHALKMLTSLKTVETYPFSTGLDIGVTVVFLEPCGINTPHLHPRATEFLVLVEGSNLKFGSILENGLVGPEQNQELSGTLNKFQGTAFPQGSIHWQFNDGCDPAVLVAALNSGNPGTSQVAQNFLGLNAAVVNATLGAPTTINGNSVQEFAKSIPVNLAQDVSSCLSRCKQQQRG
jgi:hypothetical protein